MSDKPNTTTLPDGWRLFDKYQIRHTDGTPLKGKQYFVLRLDSDDPAEAARVAAAMAAYKGETQMAPNNTNLEKLISPGIKIPPPSTKKKQGKRCGITTNGSKRRRNKANRAARLVSKLTIDEDAYKTELV